MSKSPAAARSVEPPPLDPNQKWLTTDEAARYMRVSPQVIRGLIHQGQLPAARVAGPGLGAGGGGFRLDRADLDKLLTRRKRIFPPYRKNTHPWVAARWAARRRKKGAAR